MRRELGSFSGHEASPQLNGAWRIEEEDFPQEVIAVTEDGLGSAGVCPDHDLSVFCAPLSGCMSEGEGECKHGQELCYALGVNKVGVLEIEAA